MAATQPILSRLLSSTIDALFPPRCAGCGAGGSFFCQRCVASLVPIAPPWCPKCGEPSSSDALCTRCRQHPLEIDAIRSCYRYEGRLREAVLALKYQNLRAAAPDLAQLMTSSLRSLALDVEAIVPVPLHPRRLRERGYNQSSLLARELGKATGLPVLERGLVKGRHTAPQARAADLAARRANVRDAFEASPEVVSGRRVLLIDDVCTSGSTLDAAARALKSAGASAVYGLTLAREV